jgi:anti-sigma factor RsiW
MREKRAQQSGKLRSETRDAHTCKAEVALIADYLANELSPAEIAAFEDHLSACKDCVAFLRTYKKTIEMARAFIRHQPHRNDIFLSFIRQ